MNKLKQLFYPKYKNKILNKIRELEIQLLKVKMDKTNIKFNNTKEHVDLIIKQNNLQHSINFLKELL